ncbi:MAG: glycoside hydrolase family protein [Burkholderiaceae bacterium]|jgi:lysozyme|nr:glycoside hydrolase family protein [Burkholderiaceae bacterium]
MKPVRTIVVALSVSAAGFVGIAGYETYRSATYRDSGGVLTIGYGETKGVKPGQRTTPERALARLHKSVDEHASGIKKCLGDVALAQHEFDAFVDLAYNAGVSAVCRSSIPAKLRASDYAGACQTILTFDKRRDRETGRLLSCRDPANNCLGIVRRRQETYRKCMGEEA